MTRLRLPGRRRSLRTSPLSVMGTWGDPTARATSRDGAESSSSVGKGSPWRAVSSSKLSPPSRLRKRRLRGDVERAVDGRDGRRRRRARVARGPAPPCGRRRASGQRRSRGGRRRRSRGDERQRRGWRRPDPSRDHSGSSLDSASSRWPKRPPVVRRRRVTPSLYRVPSFSCLLGTSGNGLGERSYQRKL